MVSELHPKSKAAARGLWRERVNATPTGPGWPHWPPAKGPPKRTCRTQSRRAGADDGRGSRGSRRRGGGTASASGGSGATAGRERERVRGRRQAGRRRGQRRRQAGGEPGRRRWLGPPPCRRGATCGQAWARLEAPERIVRDRWCRARHDPGYARRAAPCGRRHGEHRGPNGWNCVPVGTGGALHALSTAPACLERLECHFVFSAADPLLSVTGLMPNSL